MKQNKMKSALTKFLPADQAPDVNERVIAQIQQMDNAREKYVNKALEKHFADNILPILALYLTLQKSDPLPEDLLELTRKITEEIYKDGRKQMVFLGRLPFFYWLLQKLTPKKIKDDFPPEGWDVEWVEVSKNRVAFNMHGCFYLDALTKYGAPELTPIFCGLDDMIYDDVSPHMRWQRAGTLGLGDALCDFSFGNAKMKED